MVAIFIFSSQNGEKSENLSGSLSLGVFDVLQKGTGVSQTASFMDILNLLVRKTAHFLIYFILGFCAANTVRQVTDNIRRIFLISLIWSSFYAATDEWHQYFVPGRSCRWQDWLIDTTGVLIGVVVTLLIARRVRNAKKRKETEAI
ncbi:MAG: VanZ family protein [Oscillospiraceae bacterium]|nr:VanZ family protein [Oscillospiraceae bacterium]